MQKLKFYLCMRVKNALLYWVKACFACKCFAVLSLCILSINTYSFALTPSSLPGGLEYRHVNDSFEPVSIHILEVNPSKFKIVAARALESGIGRETVLSLAARHGAIAAVNGGFFEIDGNFDGLPKGVLKVNNLWYATPYLTRGAIGWSDGGREVYIDRLAASCWVGIDGEKLSVEGINRPGILPMVYNKAFHVNTLTSFTTKEIVVRYGKVASISTNGSSSIPEEGWVLSTSQLGTNTLRDVRINTSATYKIDLHPQLNSAVDWDDLECIIGGVPVLIHKGKKIKDFSVERARERFITGSYARTAVGVLPNGNWVFVVVDGNLPNESMGVSIEELATYMMELGCSDALNLDGGGSTTLVIGNKLVNQPTGDEDENSSIVEQRRVSDAILIIPR